jgi:hypothetical protein
MNPKAEREIVMELAEAAEHWRIAPLMGDPSVIHTTDQIAARVLDSMDQAGMTESERITFGLGFLACSQQLHGQVEDWDLHYADGLAICESIGLVAGTVARQVLASGRRA